MHGSTGGSWKRSDWSGPPKWDNPTGNRGHKGFGIYHHTIATAPAPDPTGSELGPCRAGWGVSVVFEADGAVVEPGDGGFGEVGFAEDG